MELHRLIKALPNSIILFIIMPKVQSQELPFNRSSSTVPALIVFGDSIVDPGNNNMLITPAKANFPPYGRDFKGNKATGRFSNGKIPTDIIASKIGIKELLPAYLDSDLNDEELLTGVSFASGAAGYDNLTAELPKVFSLWDQLELYKEYKRNLEGIAGEEKAANIIGESPHIIFSGSNDILATYFFTSLRANSYDLPSYIDFLVNAAESFSKELFRLGARKIGVAGVPPLGCVPTARTINGGMTRDCVDIYNDASVKFNSELAKKMEHLSTDFPAGRFIFIDIYDALLNLIQHSSDYGFEEVSKGCCGTGELEASILCNEFNPFTCPESETYKYLFWDSFHPTERAFEIIITTILPQILPLLL